MAHGPCAHVTLRVLAPQPDVAHKITHLLTTLTIGHRTISYDLLPLAGLLAMQIFILISTLAALGSLVVWASSNASRPAASLNPTTTTYTRDYRAAYWARGGARRAGGQIKTVRGGRKKGGSYTKSRDNSKGGLVQKRGRSQSAGDGKPRGVGQTRVDGTRIYGQQKGEGSGLGSAVQTGKAGYYGGTSPSVADRSQGNVGRKMNASLRGEDSQSGRGHKEKAGGQKASHAGNARQRGRISQKQGSGRSGRAGRTGKTSQRGDT